MFSKLIYLNHWKVLFLTAVVHPSFFILFSENLLWLTSVSEESAPVETSTEQSSHEVPDIAIGTIFSSSKFLELLILIRFSEV